MTEYLATDVGSTRLGMNDRQFAELVTTVATALRQTSTPLDPDQQEVELRFRLLRSGLGNFYSASEGFDRALIRIDQVHYDGWIQLVIHDPIPDKTRWMVLFIGEERIYLDVPGASDDGRRHHRIEGDVADKVVDLVKFLDLAEVTLAVGIPVQIHGRYGDRSPRSEFSANDPNPTPSRTSRVSSPKPKQGS